MNPEEKAMIQLSPRQISDSYTQEALAPFYERAVVLYGAYDIKTDITAEQLADRILSADECRAILLGVDHNSDEEVRFILTVFVAWHLRWANDYRAEAANCIDEFKAKHGCTPSEMGTERFWDLLAHDAF